MELDIELHEVHIKLLEDLIPFFGDDIEEVIRYIIIDWVGENLEREKISRINEIQALREGICKYPEKED